MREVTGKYNTAKIFTDVVDEKSIEQVKLLCDQEFVQGSKIRMMPDIHAGAGCTIGTTMTITDKICPNLVGVDIGCGMHVTKLDVKEIDFEKLDKVIRERIPCGFNVRDKEHPYYRENTNVAQLFISFHDVDFIRAKHSIGTLGGGNHFIEIDKDDDGNLYLVIHSGSRHLGVEVANYYQQLACDNMKFLKEEEIKATVKIATDMQSKLKLPGIIQQINAKYKSIPKDLSYLTDFYFDNYIHDMKIVQEYAKWNRMAIADDICWAMGWFSEEDFHTIHNYIDTENMILRKGAVSAQAGEKLLIPINMRDGSLICVGKGNPDWNYSAPHGAGRLFGRMAAKKQFSLDEYRESMEGIYTTSVGMDTLDECPMAYKSMDDIVNNITDTVDILKVIKPIYNFKAGE